MDTHINKVRVRIAPSPTGILHVGTARTALFNYLFARKYKGKFIVRIEDTDLERSDLKYEKDILENLLWLGLEWDEGPVTRAQVQNSKFKIKNYIGDYGPYRQSERTAIYKKYLETLLSQGRAFYCYHSEEELESEKQEQMKRREAPRHLCAYKESTSDQKVNKQSIIRLKLLENNGVITFRDMIRGEISFESRNLGDISLAKNLDAPLYNFSVVVDDFEMKISHVIRGEDHISNTPKQILIYEALDWPQPQWAHLPLLLGTDRSKLSKRHGSIGVGEYREMGILPEALVNFLSLLGWHPKENREEYSVKELAEDFSLEDVQLAGAIFDVNKLKWLNGIYLRKKSVEELADLIIPFIEESGLVIKKGEILESQDGRPLDPEYIKKTVLITRERMQILSDIVSQADFFFKKPDGINQELLIWKDSTVGEIKKSLELSRQKLSKISEKNWSKTNLESTLLLLAEEFSLEIRNKKDKGYLLWPLRAALSGKKASPGPMEIMDVLGKIESLYRIESAKQCI